MGWPVFVLPPWKKFSAADSRSSRCAQEDGCSSLPCRDVLSFRSEARETLGNETARVHRAAGQRRGGMAARGARAATAKDAACRLCRYAASRRPTLCEFPQADGRTRLSGRPEFHIRLHPNTERRRLRKKLSRARGTKS